MASGITIHEVAEKAGVSSATVSRVLNNKTNVSSETRAKVLNAASELGYRDAYGSITAPLALNTIGVAVKRDPDVDQNIDPFNYQIITGIETECQRMGMNMMYTSILVDEYGHATALPQMLIDPTIDGLILIGAFFEKTILSISDRASLPVVLVDACTSADLKFDAVLTDNVTSAREAVSYLIEQGHRHIGLIGSLNEPSEHISIQERRQGYLAALSEHDIGESHIEPSHLTQADSYHAVQRLLNRAPHITAIFACNDDVAVGVIRGLRDINLNVPKDVSVIGFDDTIHGQLSEPKLTTMYVDKSLMGKMAIRILHEKSANSNNVAMTVRLGTRLIVRESVSVPRKSKKRA